jgi:hypothetical protein
MATDHYRSAGTSISPRSRRRSSPRPASPRPRTPLEELGDVSASAAHAAAALEKGGPAADLLARLLVDTRFACARR